MIKPMTIQEIKNKIGSDIELNCRVYKIRRASGLIFVMLRYMGETLQAVYMPEICKSPLSDIKEGAFIRLSAQVTEEKRSATGFELTMKDFSVLTAPCEDYPLSITEPTLLSSIEQTLNNREITLRHPVEHNIAYMRSVIINAFSRFMQSNAFMQVTTPRITAMPSKADNSYIKVKYFDKDMTLSDNGSIYSYVLMGAFDRVYEVAEHFSGVNRNSARHLNEYTCLDCTMAYIDGIDDLIDLTWNAISYILNALQSESPLCQNLKTVGTVPSISFAEAMSLSGKAPGQSTLDPTDEVKLCEYSSKEFDSDFIFVKDLPHCGLPFYAKNGFVLLYKGMEIAKGHEALTDYNELCNKCPDREKYELLLNTAKYGVAPNGSVSIGLERFIMKLSDLDNIRRATLFPRDLHYMG